MAATPPNECFIRSLCETISRMVPSTTTPPAATIARGGIDRFIASVVAELGRDSLSWIPVIKRRMSGIELFATWQRIAG